MWVTYQGRKVDKDALPAKNTSSVHELCIKLYLVNNLSAVWKKRLDRALSEEDKIHNKDKKLIYNAMQYRRYQTCLISFGKKDLSLLFLSIPLILPRSWLNYQRQKLYCSVLHALRSIYTDHNH